MQASEIPQNDADQHHPLSMDSPSDKPAVASMDQQTHEVDDWFRSTATLSPIHSEGGSLRLDTSDEQSPQKQSPPSFGSFSWTGLHHRHPVKPPQHQPIMEEGAWTTPDRHRPRARRRSLRTEQSSPVPWSPYRNTTSTLNFGGTTMAHAGSFPTTHTKRTGWLSWMAASCTTMVLSILLWVNLSSRTTNWYFSSMLSNRHDMQHFSEYTQEPQHLQQHSLIQLSTQQQTQPWWSTALPDPSPFLVRQLQRKERSRPPSMTSSFEGLSKPDVVYRLDPDDPSTQHVPTRRSSSYSWATLESLCGMTAQQASLHNASSFPKSLALSTGHANVSIVGGETPTALRLAQALQVHCQARITQLIWQGPEQETSRLELRSLYHSILLNSNASLHFVDHSAWSLSRESTHLVYFAEQPINNNLSNNIDLVARIKDTVQRIRKSQHHPRILLVESSTTNSALYDWMAGVLSLRTPVVRVRIPTNMTWSTPHSNHRPLFEKSGSEASQSLVRGEHVLSAMTAAMQWHLTGVPRLFLLDGESSTTRQYLGGWTPFDGQCEWCQELSTTDHVDSCASECSDSKNCVQSIWNMSLTRDLTDGCKVILYTSVPMHDEDRHLVHAEFDNEGEVCNVAFIHRTSTLADLALQKIPHEQLLKFGMQASRDIHEQKLALLNGRLMYRGWVLVWPDLAQDSVDDWSLVKIAPSNLIAESVQYAIYTDPFEKSAYRNVTLENVQDFLSNMDLSAQDARLAHLGHKRFILPPEPAKRAILQTHRIRRPSQLAHKRLSFSLAVKILEGNRHESKPVKRHREFYHKMAKWFQPTRKPAMEPWYRYDVNPFLVDTSQVIHDLRHPHGNDLRCEWYEHHRPFASSLDALSLAHILTLRNMERRQQMEEPDDRALHHWKYWPEQLRLKNQDWLPLAVTLSGVAEADTGLADSVEARLRYRMVRAPFDSAALSHALAMEQEEGVVLARASARSSSAYVRLLSLVVANQGTVIHS